MAAPLAAAHSVSYHDEDEWRGGGSSELIKKMVSSEIQKKDHRGNRNNKVEEVVAAVVTGRSRDVPDREEEEDLSGEQLLRGGLFSGELGTCFKSMEDAVNDFDVEKLLSSCFRNDNTGSNETDIIIIAPVNLITEDTVLKRDEIWNALTDKYGQAMPVDWRRSRTRSLHAPPFKRAESPALGSRRGAAGDEAAEQSDDEELREQLDMHSIIVSCLSEEPLFTAEQVIEEIEEMMQYSPDQHPSQADLSMLALDIQRSSVSQSHEDRVRALSIAGLNERLEEVETTIRRFSEELIQHLALRDELDFEKEVKDSFISVLIDVQNRQKEQRELLRKKKRMKSGAGSLQARTERMQTLGSYLTTVIPYEKKGGPPSLEDLQILTNILQAMRDDSDKVPSLLTDYILKVLCPT